MPFDNLINWGNIHINKPFTEPHAFELFSRMTLLGLQREDTLTNERLKQEWVSLKTTQCGELTVNQIQTPSGEFLLYTNSKGDQLRLERITNFDRKETY